MIASSMKTAASKQAVIATGGKQYLVAEGQKLRVEKLEAVAGKKVVFDTVLLTAAAGQTTVGTPHVSGAKVEATVVSHGKADKVVGAKVKPKKRYKKYFGHRQPYTEVEITKIAVQ